MKLIRKIRFGSIQIQNLEFFIILVPIWFKGVTAVNFETTKSTRDLPL